MRVAVIGQGYVGLPLALEAAKAGFQVTGIETDQSRLDSIKNFRPTIENIASEDVKTLISSQMYKPLNELPQSFQPDIICVCVPTPLNEFRKPDLSYLREAIIQNCTGIKPGTLIIIESTIQPGATREVVLPLIERVSGLVQNEFLLAFSPERVDPMNRHWNLNNTPKLVAGISPKASELAKFFYSKFIDEVFICSSVEIAEFSKLLENSFRLINISFINEMAILCNQLDIDISEVIQAASSKPYGFMPFYPSLGAGGHCIPVDPLYLKDRAQRVGVPTAMIDLADQINRDMPKYYVNQAEIKLNGLNEKRILVIGVAYKPNVSDTRETSASYLIQGLRDKGAQVFWHDELVMEWNGEKSVDLSNNYDLAILTSVHDSIDLKKLSAVPILNTRNKI
jgi:UDP-N-acetyl-D-glucosamine dehydrogenase